jgi:hypothetical protein
MIFGQGVDGAALEEQEVPRHERTSVCHVVHPERAIAREHVKVLIAGRMVVRRRPR